MNPSSPVEPRPAATHQHETRRWDFPFSLEKLFMHSGNMDIGNLIILVRNCKKIYNSSHPKYQDSDDTAGYVEK
jgi:hypothetical protein